MGEATSRGSPTPSSSIVPRDGDARRRAVSSPVGRGGCAVDTLGPPRAPGCVAPTSRRLGAVAIAALMLASMHDDRSAGAGVAGWWTVGGREPESGKSRLIDEPLDTLADVDAASRIWSARVRASRTARAMCGRRSRQSDRLAPRLRGSRSRSTDPSDVPPTRRRALRGRRRMIADVDRVVEVYVHLLGYPSGARSHPDRPEPASRCALTASPKVDFAPPTEAGAARAVDRRPALGRRGDHRTAASHSPSLDRAAVLVITAQRDDADVVWPPATDHPITVRSRWTRGNDDEVARMVERDARRQR